MENNLYNTMYNPDVLSCIANLSNDEVFTPPEVANAMLDLLPQELFSNPNTTFLDPACKSGVFLREIAKRLIIGLEPVYPDLQERTDHIFKKQLFGIAITELTSHLSRRSLYCSKTANGNYSVVHFDTVDGNVRFKTIRHRWKDGKCVFCGASQKEYDRAEDLETHAYEMIHTTKPEEIFKMKFDVIISNPPYHLSTTENSQQAKPLYHLFVEQAKKLKPRFLSMIIPARWFSGGIGLEEFRESMLNGSHITRLVDFPNSKDCFTGVSISGGVCYFLWDRDKEEKCVVTNIIGNQKETMSRSLNEFSTFVRYNSAISIIHKAIRDEPKVLSSITSAVSPFGLSTKVRGSDYKTNELCVPLHSSKGISYISKNNIIKGNEWIGKYKVLVSQTGAEHAGEPSKDGKFRVLTSSLKPIGKSDVCTHSYVLVGPFDSAIESKNCANYLKTQFVRFLILQAVSSIHISKNTFIFVPIQDFSKPWTDEELYAKYGLTDDEIAFIDSMIRPMDIGGDA